MTPSALDLATSTDSKSNASPKLGGLPVDLATELQAPIWKTFAFETGHFLLHVPSSHVVEVSPEVVRHIRGDAAVDGDVPAQEIEKALRELAASLPMPVLKEEKPDINMLSLNMAQGCNLRCSYCFAGEGDYGNKSMMSLETAQAAIRLFATGKERFNISFFGGEPLLAYPVIQQVVAWCETMSTKFSYVMTTNASLLTAEKLAWLNSKKFRLNISYDGKGLQTKQRFHSDKKTSSEPLIERKLAAFREQLSNLRDTTLRTTVMRANLADLETSIVSTLHSKDYKLAISRHATDDKKLAFTAEDISRLAEILGRVIDRLLASEDYEKLLKMTQLRDQIRTIHRGETGLKACGAGINYLTVSTQGRFYLCHRFNEDESENFGDIRRGVDQTKMTEVVNFRRSANASPAKGAAECSSCWMRQWCSGGCMHENKAATGDKFHLDPTYCQMMNHEIGQAMRVYTILRERAPELLDKL